MRDELSYRGCECPPNEVCETNGEGEAGEADGLLRRIQNQPFGNAGRRKVVVYVITLANARGVPLHGRILEQLERERVDYPCALSLRLTIRRWYIERPV